MFDWLRNLFGCKSGAVANATATNDAESEDDSKLPYQTLEEGKTEVKSQQPAKAEAKNAATSPQALVEAKAAPSEEIQPVPFNTRVMRFLNYSALFADLVCTSFLYMAAANTIDTCLEESNAQNEILATVLKVFAMYFSAANVISNFSTINPVEDADTFTRLVASEDEGKADARSNCERRSTTTLIISNQVIANLTYVVGSAAQVVSLKYLIPNNNLTIGIGIPFTLLGVLYYNMLTYKKVKEHAKVCLHGTSMMLNAYRFPLVTFEALLQVVGNTAFRSLSNAFIMSQLLRNVLNTSDDTSVGLGLIEATAILTGYITIFSRTLNVTGVYFNKGFARLTTADLQAAKVSKAGMLSDIIVTLLRSGTTGFLISKLGPQNVTLKIVLGTVTGSLLTMHGIYVNYTLRRKQSALAQLNQALNNSSQLAIAPKSSLNELSKRELFNTIRDLSNSPYAELYVATINTSARLGRALSFIGFLLGLNESLKNHGVDLNLDFTSILCLSGMWGVPTLLNEWSFFEMGMLQTVKYHTTKFRMETEQPYYGRWCSFFHSIDEYPKDYIRGFLPGYNEEKQQQKPEKNDRVPQETTAIVIRA